MNIESKIFSYSEIANSIPPFGDDPFGIAAYYSEQRRQTFLHNPNLNDLSECALILGYVNDTVAGRAMHFPTKLKLEGTIQECITGSALEVAEPFRHLAIGADIMTYPVFKDRRDFVIAAGISEQTVGMYKKLKYTVLDYQRCLRINNATPIFKSKGLNTFFSSCLGLVLNLFFKGYYKLRKHKPCCRYTVSQIYKIPESINNISLNDQYKFMEVHDSKWLQWNLEYNFTDNPKNKKFFYIISENSKDVGFFMIKETFRKKAGWIKDVVIGSIVEWGTIDENLLTESDIYNIAINYFSKDVDLIEIASSNDSTVKNMSKQGFVKFRLAHIAFKDKRKKYPGAKDIKNWRIRLGYADVIFT